MDCQDSLKAAKLLSYTGPVFLEANLFKSIKFNGQWDIKTAYR